MRSEHILSGRYWRKPISGTYHPGVRRAGQGLSRWLVQQPLWRYLLIFFAIWLAIGYAGSSAATWTSNHLLGMAGQAYNDTSLTFHGIWAAVMTCMSWFFRARWRRLLDLRVQRKPNGPGPRNMLPPV
jgi:hypothetical protein